MGWKIGVFPMDYMFFDIWVFFFMNDWHCWKKFSEIIQQKESGICPSTQNLAVFFFHRSRFGPQCPWKKLCVSCILR